MDRGSDGFGTVVGLQLWFSWVRERFDMGLDLDLGLRMLELGRKIGDCQVEVVTVMTVKVRMIEAVVEYSNFSS